MKKNKFLIPVFLIAIIVWGVVLIRQQKNIIQYQKEIKELSTKINVAQDELDQNKQNLEEEINKFLNNCEFEIIDIKFNSAVAIYGEEQIFCFSALIMYKE